MESLVQPTAGLVEPGAPKPEDEAKARDLVEPDEDAALDEDDTDGELTEEEKRAKLLAAKPHRSRPGRINETGHRRVTAAHWVSHDKTCDDAHQDGFVVWAKHAGLDRQTDGEWRKTYTERFLKAKI